MPEDYSYTVRALRDNHAVGSIDLTDEQYSSFKTFASQTGAPDGCGGRIMRQTIRLADLRVIGRSDCARQCGPDLTVYLTKDPIQ